MAFFNTQNISPVTMTSGEALTANTLVKLSSTAGQVLKTTAITEAVFGVVLDTVTASGESVRVQTDGIAKVMVSAACATVGVEMMPGASGKAAAASGATAMSFGLLMEAAGADGDIVSVKLIPAGHGAANS